MLARGVQSGIYSPNEARNREGLDSVAFGDEPRVQAQVVPLSAASGIPSAPATALSPSARAAEKNYEATKQRDLDALNARRVKRPGLTGKGNGATAPRVIRKTKANALQRSASAMR